MEVVRAESNRVARRLGDLGAPGNLTALQSEFWIGQKLHPDAGLFNCVDNITIRGAIEPDHFQAAFQALIDKTDALRTIFEEVEGVPWQRVVDPLPYKVEYLDFSPESAPSASFEDWMQQRARAPLDIAKRSFDCALAKISEDQFIWYLGLHHIVADGWTFHLIFHRMQELYGRSLEGRLDEPITFPPFREVIETERAYYSTSQYSVDQSYWEKTLIETQPLTFYGRQAARRPASVRRISYELGPEPMQKLKSLAQRDEFAGKTLNIALFNMLTSVLAAYLYKISGNEHFSLGTPFSNRRSPALRETAGLVMQVAPLRVTIAKDDTFASLIQKLQGESAEAARHCRYPLFEHSNNLYDVIFNFRSGFLTTFHGMPVQERVIRSGNDRYSFSLHVRYLETETLLLQFDFHPDVFDERQQTRAIEHFLHALDAFLRDPDQRIDRLRLLSPEETRCVVREFNKTSVAFPEDSCVHQLVEAQANKSPDALAVEFPAGTGDSVRLSYDELNRKANQLAHHLVSLGVGPEVLVGICMERSADMVIALLAILKAGGAYVPLDPDYPQERLTCMLEDADISILVTQDRLTERLPPAHRVRVVCLDSDWPAIACQSDQNLATGVTTQNLAYVIFTSGSTGRPKGAMNTHGGICNRLLWMQQAYFLESADRILQKTPLSFDVSVWELFWPLMTGAGLVVALPGGHKDSAYLAKVIAQQKITTIHFVPSMLQAFLRESNSLAECGSLKRVICSGEALTRELQDKFFACLGAELHNLYGPTEAAVDVTSWLCSRASMLPSIPIGYPIANMRIYILDSLLQPVPLGVTGELHIGGIGLARGYANRADLTAEKFIPNPFSELGGERLYKTGDLARHRHDGSIEFLGRIDHQVKIRGFRVELGEIETVLRHHPAVLEAVVVVREDSNTDNEPQDSKSANRLVAYVVARPKKVLSTAELRSLLKQKLPEYMMPSAFVVMDALPLGPSGKIDRRALPAPKTGRPDDMPESYVAPRTPTEEILAGIWARVLKFDRIGVHDNFFDLGGHSLTATQVASRIRRAFKIDLSLRSIFEKPTVAELAAYIDTALPKRPEAEIAASLPQRGVVTRSPSSAQQRLWFLEQLAPGTPLYNIAEAFRLRGAINITALEKSFDEIVRRHEALRTTFSSVDGSAMQVIAPSLSLTLPVLDLTNGPEDNPERVARRLAREEAERPFDLARGPLLRATLLRLGHEDHLLLVTMHHIISDGWSMAILLRELTALYDAFSKGQASPLQELGVQYSDYAQWQHRWLSGAAFETQVSYWKQQLAGLATLELRTDRPRPAIQSFRGDQQISVLPKTLTSALKTLSQEQHVTVFMVLLAAFKALLHCYSGQRDIAVGVPIAGRNRFEFEQLIGLFVNTLVLRSELASECTFRELVNRVRDVCLSAYSHQDLPFEQLVEQLNPVRDLGRNPLFQVLFQVRNLPKEALQLAGVTTGEFPFERSIARFDLSLDITEIAGELRCVFTYNTDLFDASSIEKMQQHYRQLLECVVTQPDGSIGEIAPPVGVEKGQRLVEANDTDESALNDCCIHRLFEEQSAHTPNALAVVFEEEKLTYGELNGRANRLARYLRKQGVGPEVLVGLYMERSAEMIVGLLATLKAGGAYLPLDPDYPKERLDFILEDARPAVVLTHQQLAHRLSNQRAVVIALDGDWEDMAHGSGGNLLDNPTVDGLAYVIYTSGSTGKPKGVMVEHGQLMNYCRAAIKRLQPGTASSFAMVQPLMFDSSVTVIFVSLLTGGAIHVISKQRALDPHALGDYFHKRPIDFLKITPSHLASLQSASVPALVMPRRCLILGGEESRREWIFSLQALAPDCTIFNHYGPTETAVGVLMYRVRQEDGAPGVSKTPLGRPLAGTQVHLLDQSLKPVSAGVAGELYVGGLNVTRGYLNRAELTAERFIPDPFSGRPGSRLYKSGDLARYLPDGNIEFLGRADEQVKIRGFRVEPGEVESTLTCHPGVREAVVMARQEGPGEKRLVGYVVTNGPLEVNVLRGFLKEKLPDYMIPSALVLLDALPLTPNGKLDREALPLPEAVVASELHDHYVAPRTATEKRIAKIWTDLLHIHRVSIRDNFFDLGGHSLLAIQLVSRIRDAFQIELPLRSLFEHPTIAELAERITPRRREENASTRLLISRDVFCEAYPLSFAQERFWFLNQLEPNNAAYKVSHGFHLRGPLNINALERSIAEIVRRHETLRTTIQLRDGKPFQVVPDRWSFRLDCIELDETVADLEAEIQRLYEDECCRSFDLSRDLLLRATLLRLGSDEYALFLSTHHIAWDHWCIELFFRELSALYQAYSAGKPSPLIDPPIQYKDYALWQRETFQGVELENRLDYWRRQLYGAPLSLNLPTDHPRKPLRDRRGKRRSVVLPSGFSEQLIALGRDAGMSLFMIFLAAFQTLLHRLTSQDDIVVGTPVAGRDRSETEGLIGLFLNSLALRTDLSGNPTFRELLARVREMALGAYEHQDLPFEKLVEELQPERDLTRTPVFQVFINMYNFKEASLDLDRLSVQPISRSEYAPQFDIEFFIREHNDGIHLTFGYDADLFETSTIDRILGHFRVLLGAITAAPETRLSDLPILTAAETRQLLRTWNDNKRDYPADKCVHQLFEEQAKRTPEAVAVVFENQQLTYGELNLRANQLAHYLKRLGVGPEVLVGLCMERSTDMIIGLLGIWKAGGAYLPLDPAYPKQRLVFMLENSKTSIVVTQQRTQSNLPEVSGMTVLSLDTEREKITKEAKENLRDELNPGNLAYVLYTSGSTGSPKGVSVEHRQLTNYIFAVVERLDFAGGSSFATVSSLAADLGNTSIFSSLCTGGALHVISQDKVSDANAMAEYMSDHAIDYLKIVPSHLAALQTAFHAQHILPRKTLILGGEAANVGWVRDIQSRAADLAIVNHYGPTEATIGVLTYRLKPGPFSMHALPLGQPLSNVEIYLLDKYLRPVPVGVAAELYVGGLNVTRGYVNRAELTAERFLPNPFSDQPGSRLYRSGDLARYLPDGNIEFVGRADEQVKIRGFRVEPGEVETVLKQYPDVRDAVVVARDGAGGQKGLIGYVVPRRHRAPTSGAKRYNLPNGIAVAQLNKNETDYLYEEIFERQAYLKHGITIKDGDCVFDVGANIGLFTLFTDRVAKNLKIYSFEPNPTVFEILEANTSSCEADVNLFNCGLSDVAKSAEFTFFPRFSLFSGFYADAQKEKEVVKTFMVNQQKAGVVEMGELLEAAEEILDERFLRRSFTAQLKSLSAIIEEANVDCIDLLKINVEKSELDVLKGIKDSDWSKINQVVLEVDVKENLDTILSLLETHGYEFVVEQDALLKNTQLCYVYAVRPPRERRLIDKQEGGAHIRPLPVINDSLLSVDELRHYLREKLPDYMIPSAFVLLDALPLTPNGKVDRRGLPAPDPVQAELRHDYLAPRTATEKRIAEIWADLLYIDKVGIHDNFFDLGGHSLLATQVMSRLRETFNVEVRLRTLFEQPTLAGLAERVDTLVWAAEEPDPLYEGERGEREEIKL